MRAPLFVRLPLWGLSASLVVGLALVLALFHPGSGTPSSSAHVGTGEAHVEIDMDPSNGTGPCNPVDTSAEIPLGAHQVAVCLSDVQTGYMPQAFQFALLYDDTLNQCLNNDTCNPPGVPCDTTALNDNPNILEANMDAAAGWDCNTSNDFGGQPACDLDPATGPGHGKAFIGCLANVGPTTTVGNGITTAVALVSFDAIASGVDTMTLDEVDMTDEWLISVAQCFGGGPCYGGEMVKGPTPTPPPPTPTDTPIPPTPTETPTPTATATVVPGAQHIEIDMLKDGSTWCNPVDTTAPTHYIGLPYQVAVCLSDSPAPPAAFRFDLTYDDTLNACTDLNQGGTYLDDNPDANVGVTSWTIPDLGAGWDCSGGLGGLNQPVCDRDTASGPGRGRASITCQSIDAPALPVGAGISSPVAVINFTPLADGVDNLALEYALLYDENVETILECSGGAPCHGATDVKAACPYPDDADCDGVPDASDQCPNTPWNGAVDENGCLQTEVDQDIDGVCDPGKSSLRWCTGSDNCPADYNPDQLNTDGGRRPNGTRIPNDYASNPSQDKLGDVCDPDDDNDNLPDAQEFDDHCPYRLVADSDDDGAVDGFEVADGFDPCDAASTPPSEDALDSDGDGLLDGLERSGYNTCAFVDDTYPAWATCVIPQDSDEDGCADTLEVLDLNGDRRVSVTDYLILAKRYSGSIPDDDPISEKVFDVNKDGRVSVTDLLMLAKNTCSVRPGQIGCYTCPPE